MSLFFEEWGPILWQGFLETLTMTGITLVISLAIGLPLGVFLTLTRKGGQSENLVAYSILNWVINILRSLPFIILLFLMIPVTRFVVGTTIGIQGVIMPLVVFTAPYIARLMESALLEVGSWSCGSLSSNGDFYTENHLECGYSRSSVWYRSWFNYRNNRTYRCDCNGWTSWCWRTRNNCIPIWFPTF